jgi:hypothetical protein
MTKTERMKVIDALAEATSDYAHLLWAKASGEDDPEVVYERFKFAFDAVALIQRGDGFFSCEPKDADCVYLVEQTDAQRWSDVLKYNKFISLSADLTQTIIRCQEQCLEYLDDVRERIAQTFPTGTMVTMMPGAAKDTGGSTGQA